MWNNQNNKKNVFRYVQLTHLLLKYTRTQRKIYLRVNAAGLFCISWKNSFQLYGSISASGLLHRWKNI